MKRDWHLAPSLVRFRREVNAKWPDRSKKSDGTKGNASHAARASDHNPNTRGSVNAIDITWPSVDAQEIIDAVSRHPAASYVIFNRKIYSRTNRWKPMPYKGTNPHTGHLHISIKQTVAAEQSTASWFSHKPAPVKPAPVKPAKPAVVVKKRLPLYAGPRAYSVGSKGEHVKVVQLALRNKVTGVMSQSDVNKVRSYQRLRPKLWPADGVVGPRTYSGLASSNRVRAVYR